jgi:pyridinium-3,5-biscarboxylic acid mononucleotide sulfurtransferase
MTDSPSTHAARRLADLHEVLRRHPRRLVACSGGVDSLLLATVAHRAAPASAVVAHAVTPAVPGAATGRVMTVARREGWSLKLVTPGELDDERYLANPTDRCYFCKSHLYTGLDLIADQAGDERRSVLLVDGHHPPRRSPGWCPTAMGWW